jgi:hypothetical protein
MVAYYGKSSMKQFVRCRPIRFGFKKWCLAGSSGYCYQSNLYLWKDGENPRPDNMPLGTQVVTTLVDACFQDYS